MVFCETIEKAVASIDKALRQSKRGEAVLKSMQSTSSLSKNAQAGPSSSTSGKQAETASSSMTNLTDDELKARYTAWAKENNYSYYQWNVEPTEGQTLAPQLAFKHAYSAEAANMVSHSARNMTLMKEVRGISIYDWKLRRANFLLDTQHASLSSSLPAGWNSSVFLKVDESRPDIMKVRRYLDQALVNFRLIENAPNLFLFRHSSSGLMRHPMRMAVSSSISSSAATTTSLLLA